MGYGQSLVMTLPRSEWNIKMALIPAHLDGDIVLATAEWRQYRSPSLPQLPVSSVIPSSSPETTQRSTLLTNEVV